MGDLLSSIFGYIGDAAIGALESFVVWLYQFIVIVFQVLYQVIFIVAQFFMKIAAAVAGFFDRLWNGFFKSIFTKVWDAVKAAQSWLETHLRPLIDFLKKVRAYLDRYFNLYIRPILLLIQHIRQYLQILSLLHIQVAQKLDAYLAQLQAKIVQSFATVTATINTLIDVANAIMDPEYLIRHPVLLLSIRRQIPALIHAVTGRPPGYWFPSPKGSSGDPFAPPSLPFNFADPAQNPPTHSYLGNDGVGDLGGLLDVFTFADASVDQAQPLDYFNDTLYPQNRCPGDPVNCLAYTLGFWS